MATIDAALASGLESMVDCTPEPLRGPLKDGDKIAEATSPTETGSCVSGGDLDGDADDDDEVNNKSDNLAEGAESELETEVEDEGDVDDDNSQEEEAPAAVPMPEEGQQKQASAESMKLNDAFVALENMRKANLEVEFGGEAIANVSLLHEYCTTCLHSLKKKEDRKLKKLSKDPDFLKNPNNAKRRKWMKQIMTQLRSKKRSPPCLICTSPVCSKHCCKSFKKEKINICGKCSQLFTMDFVVQAIASDPKNGADPEKQEKAIAHMIDSYDRALLMLRYSAQYIDEIASALENRSRTSDHIGLGSSGVGLMSGFTGVAAIAAQFVAAAAVLSPAGPPLVMASIFFGASAAACSTGTEAVNYYSEPNQLACKIIALHDLIRSLLGVTSVLKDAIQRGHIDPRHFTEMAPTKKRSTYWKSRLPRKFKAPTVKTVNEKEEEEEEDTLQESLNSASSGSAEGDNDDIKRSAEAGAADVEQASSSVVAEQQEKSKEEAKIEQSAGLVEKETPKVEKEATEEKASETQAEKDASEGEKEVAEDKVGHNVAGEGSEAGEAANEWQTQENPKPKEPEQPQYSLADIDDDDDDGEPPSEEKQDAETAATESTSFESEVDPDLAKGEDTGVASPVKEIEGDGDGEGDGEDSKETSEAVVVPPKSNEEAKKAETTVKAIAPSNKRTAISRAMTNSMKLAQFASIACVMLSAATIIMETKNLRDTLESLRKGSPCEKAAMLRKIKEEIQDLPETSVVAEGCESYVRATAKKNTAEQKPEQGDAKPEHKPEQGDAKAEAVDKAVQEETVEKPGREEAVEEPVQEEAAEMPVEK